MRLDLHLHHLQRAPQHAAEDVAVPELVLRAAVVGQLDKVGEGVLLEDQRKLLAVARPVGYGGCDVEEDLEADLEATSLLTHAQPPLPTDGFHRVPSHWRGGTWVVRTLEIISAVSRKFAQRFIVLDLAR